MIRANQNYLEKDVLQGSPLDHIILLYNKTINCLKQVKKAIDSGLNSPDIVKLKADNLSKVIDILVYLEAILDMEKGGEIAKNLKEIYDILIDELIKVNFTNDLKTVEDAIEIFENLKTAWLDIKNSIPLNFKEPSFQNLSIRF